MNAPDAGDERSQIFDRDELLASIHGDHDLMQQFVQLFLRDFPQKIETLRAAAPAGTSTRDAGALREATHKILGSARTMRLHRLAAAAEELQQLIDSQTYRLEELTAGVARVVEEYHQVVALLRR